MSSLLVRRQRRSLRTRLGAAATAFVLPLALVACGGGNDNSKEPTPNSSDGTSNGDAISAIQAGFEDVLDAEELTLELSLVDTEGNLKKALDSDTDIAKVSDLIIGGKVRLSIDPAGEATLRDLSGFGAGADIAEALKATNFGLAVAAEGDDFVQLRLVEGALYAKADLDKIDKIATQAGESGLAEAIDQFGASGSPFAEVLQDVQAGKWLKLDLLPFLSAFGGLANSFAPSGPASASAEATDNGGQLVEDLIAAVLPAITATGDDGSYEIDINARQALTAVAGVFTMSSFLPGLENAVDPLEFSDVPADGVLQGTVTLDGGSIQEITLDLESINSVVPPEDRTDSPLTGSFLKLTVDDEAKEISVPDNVSSVDLKKLIGQFFAQAFSGFGGSTNFGGPGFPTPS